MNKKVISTQNAPAAIGPYSQAIKVGNFLYTSGQVPFDPKTMEVVSQDIKEQTKQVMENLKAIFDEAGTSFDKVIKMTVFIKDMNQFGDINEVYGTYFGETPPARSCVEVARLPRDVGIEIEAIVIVD